ncbi:MAG: glucosamine-6-phosphate deaminase [Treponema sp.]|nr:glucosamine-6-phosphate deaminase [Treponema sp.]
MRICIYETKDDLGKHAAAVGAEQIRQAIKTKGKTSIILATGASQFEMLAALVNEPLIDWKKVTVFHLDEYVGIPETHPASFRKYLKERFAAKVPPLAAFHYINGDAADTAAEVKRLNALIQNVQIDAAFIGIGENGHLAFNDPPADLKTADPYLIVELNEACRKQQQGEGWFPAIKDVPRRAISMSIPFILKSRRIICTVPDSRKAKAVNMALYGKIDQKNPCASLRSHADCYLMMDRPAAGKILGRG